MDGGLGVDLVAESVDGDVMMEPAECYEVVGVMIAAVVSLFDVVGLEAVAAVASFDRTLVVVPPLHVSSDGAGDGLSHVGIRRGGGGRR